MSGLTPIRVRGRRKRKVNHGQSQDEVRSSQGKRLMSLEASQRSLHLQRKRPFISGSSSWLESQPQSQLELQSLSLSQSELHPRKKKKKNLSRLERLPVELIEKIFLYALNANFARCSPALAAAVSSERIYRVLVLLAFWVPSSLPGDDGVSAGVARILRPLDDYVPLGEEERRVLQGTVLRCKWCTVHRVLNQLPALMNLTVQQLWIDAGVSMEQGQRGNLDRFLEGPREDGSIRTFEGTKDNNHYTLTITPLVSIRITSPETNQDSTHHVLNLLNFPSHLLRGDPGFNSHTIAFLELLRRTSGFNRPDPPSLLATKNTSISHDALQEGIHTSIINRNHDALATLLKIDEYSFRSSYNTPGGGEIYTLPAEHYRAALPSTTTFQTLLRASAESLPPDDSSITAWAVERDDAFGNWLLDLMVRMPELREAAREDPGRGVFYMGGCNGESEMGGRYLREVLGVEELGGWMGEGLDFVSMAR